MKINRLLLLLISCSILQLSCKDNNVEPLVACDKILDGWEITTSEFPIGYKQNDLFFYSDELGFSVGRNGTILKTTNGGKDWELLEYYYLTETGYNPDALTRANIEAVHFIDESIGFAGGEGEHSNLQNIHTDAVFLKTSDGGDHWEKIYLDSVYKVNDLIFFDQNNGLSLFTTRNASNSLDNIIHVTHDGGAHWTKIILPGMDIESYKFITTPDLIMVIAEDLFWKTFLWASEDHGLTWHQLNFPEGPCGIIRFINNDIGFANCATNVFPDGVFQTHDGGMTWTEVNIPINSWSVFHFNTPQEGFVINPIYEEIQDPLEPYVLLSGFDVFQTWDGGSTWKIKQADKICDFEGITFSRSGNKLYVLGSSFIMFEKI